MDVAQILFLAEHQRLIKAQISEEKLCSSVCTDLLRRPNTDSNIWTRFIQSRPLRGTIPLCLFLLTHFFTFIIQWCLYMCVCVCVEEREAGRASSTLNKPCKQIRASSCSREGWEIEPSAALCCTAASAKTQYVGSKGACWQQLSPRRISAAL